MPFVYYYIRSFVCIISFELGDSLARLPSPFLGEETKAHQAKEFRHKKGHRGWWSNGRALVLGSDPGLSPGSAS